MHTTIPPAVAPASGPAVRRHLERAQAVWQAAVALADEPARGGNRVALEVLRTAEFDPSTLRHALTLGHTLLRRRPQDARLRAGRQLLQAATDWLGVPAADGEVGSAGRGSTPSRGPAPRSSS
jgi:hypothetical protein